MSRDAMLLVDALRDPSTTRALDTNGWTALIAMARVEQLIGTLAERLKSESAPPKVAEILAEARVNADYQRRSALWEAECAARALSDYPGKVVLMKGTAYVTAGLKAGEGRHIGDLDIMVARDDLPQVEALLLSKGGWEWVKEDAYDDAYYRDHMHELPPLIHKERDRMIDVHHTILPLTAKPKPDAAGMLADALLIDSNLTVRAEPVEARNRSESRPSTSSGRTETLCVLSPHRHGHSLRRAPDCGWRSGGGFAQFVGFSLPHCAVCSGRPRLLAAAFGTGGAAPAFSCGATRCAAFLPSIWHRDPTNMGPRKIGRRLLHPPPDRPRRLGPPDPQNHAASLLHPLTLDAHATVEAGAAFVDQSGARVS